MAGTTTYLQGKLGAQEFNGVAFAFPTTIYVALLLCTNGPIARSTVYAVGNTASFVAADGANHLYECTAQTGASAAAAPVFPGASNEVITDGLVTWTEQTAALEAGTAQVEPAVGGYARVGVAASTAGFTVAAPNVTNAALFSFPNPTAPWETAPAQFWAFATYDAATAGNGLRFGGLTSDQIVNTGNTVSVAVGAIKFTLDK